MKKNQEIVFILEVATKIKANSGQGAYATRSQFVSCLRNQNEILIEKSDEAFSIHKEILRKLKIISRMSHNSFAVELFNILLNLL